MIPTSTINETDTSKKKSNKAFRIDFENKKIGSISYLPAIFGCFCAYEAIFSLLKEKNSSKK